MNQQSKAYKDLIKIETLLAQGRFSDFEQKNITHDLQRVFEKLSSGLYRESHFIDRSGFDSGIRTEEFFHYLEGYVSQSKNWARILNGLLKVYQPNNIMDMCPGWAPKIELALLSLKYDKTVYLFDRSANSLKKLKSFVETFSPQYRLRLKTGDFFSNQQKPKSSMVVANHILDDLLLSLMAKRVGVPLSQLYATEGSFVQITKQIMQEKTITETFPDLFYRQMNQFISPKGVFVMVHYPGLTESTLALRQWIKFCHTLFKECMQIFLQHGYRDITKTLTVPSRHQQIFAIQKL